MDQKNWLKELSKCIANDRENGIIREIDTLIEYLVYQYLRMNIKCGGRSLHDFLAEIEKRAICKALKTTHGHQKQASHILSVRPNSLCMKMKKYQIKKKEYSSIDSSILSNGESRPSVRL